jgi:hypothetical protein
MGDPFFININKLHYNVSFQQVLSITSWYTGNMIKTPLLTQEQVDQYKTEGYIIHQRPVFSEERFHALKLHFDAKLAEWPKDERPEAMDVPHFRDPKLLEWALSGEVLDIVEPILGPDFNLFSTHFICKPTGDGRRVPWHEDSAYWRKQLDPMEVCTIWLAIDESTLENGCMKVIPRTHSSGRMGFSDYGDVDTRKNVFPTEILPTQRKDELAVPVELQPNHCSIHDVRLMHGSEPNTSNKRRCGWTLRFMPSYVKFHEDFHETHVIYPARGRNLAGNILADPTKAYNEMMDLRMARRIKSH